MMPEWPIVAYAALNCFGSLVALWAMQQRTSEACDVLVWLHRIALAMLSVGLFWNAGVVLDIEVLPKPAGVIVNLLYFFVLLVTTLRHTRWYRRGSVRMRH